MGLVRGGDKCSLHFLHLWYIATTSVSIYLGKFAHPCQLPFDRSSRFRKVGRVGPVESHTSALPATLT